MPNPIASLSVAAKYCRDERWDIFGRLLVELNRKYKDKQGGQVPLSFIHNALVNAGAVLLDTQLLSNKPPRYQIRGLAKIGFSHVKATVFDDASLTIEGTNGDS